MVLRRFDAGETIVVRQVRRGRFRVVTPMVVVDDSDDLVALYVPQGTRLLAPADASGVQTRDVLAEVGLVPDVWHDAGALHLIPRGAAASIMARWRSSMDDFAGYYVNLQEPAHRTPIGFDTSDQTLDIEIAADLSEWAWKDEDELVRATEGGFFTPSEARATRTEGERIIALAQAAAPPFDRDWGAWRPPVAWRIPELLDGWERAWSSDSRP